VLRDIIEQVEARVGKVKTDAVPASAAKAGAVVNSAKNGRTIPRAAWQGAR
jgi:hypothetical protein